MLSLSVIIPAYNEAQRILPYVQHITAYLDQRNQPYEILVVDDGSRDETAAVVEQFQAQHQAVRLVRLPTNRGKGHAVRTGMQQAQGELRLMADADGATPIQELERLEAAIHNGADLAIGSRPLAYSDARYKVQVRWHRSWAGNLFNWFVQRLGIPGIRDTQCGFKLFHANVARDLFSVSRIDGYGFDLELLYVAQRRGYQIAEVPINWADQPGSKVLVLRDGFRMFRELLAVKRNDAKGLYERQGGH
ncbi:MAG: glycosyltransferase family 2 protein [Nitrospirota bacterium]|nr:glycosyltransferase family 2 protein [Nitrospirota bacterium]